MLLWGVGVCSIESQKFHCVLSSVFSLQRPLALAKILGAYSIGFKNSKTGSSKRMDVVVMENLLYGRNFSRVRTVVSSSTFRGGFLLYIVAVKQEWLLFGDWNFTVTYVIMVCMHCVAHRCLIWRALWGAGTLIPARIVVGMCCWMKTTWMVRRNALPSLPPPSSLSSLPLSPPPSPSLPPSLPPSYPLFQNMLLD